MRKICSYCLKPYDSDNKSYCSRDCNDQQYALLQTDPARWRALRAQAQTLTGHLQEMDIEEAIARGCEQHAYRLETLLAPVFAEHPGPLQLDLTDQTQIERLANGQYRTSTYLYEGDFATSSEDDLLEACRHIARAWEYDPGVEDMNGIWEAIEEQLA